MINKIAERLNKRAKTKKFEIANLYKLREDFLGKKRLNPIIFSKQTIFTNKYYAFHHGGRSEMQFNVGRENIDGKMYTRFALCFSLEPSQSLKNPVQDLEQFRKNFNQCFDTHPDYFKSFKMWYHKNGKLMGFFSPKKILLDWFQSHNFIAIGNIINKPFEDINDKDLDEILNGFDKLLPIYKFCVLQNPTALLNGKQEFKKRKFIFKPGRPEKSLLTKISKLQKKEVQSKPIHDNIQVILFNELVKIYGKKRVGMETNTGNSTRVDVVVNSTEGVILYEVKSYSEVKITIREAFGQLLEYAYYPDPIKKLKELIIVSHIPIGEIDIEYIKYIRKLTSLNIFYQSVNLKNKTLSDKV